ncbi:dihydrolipoyl dehydrogenase [uncultured Clostridium sp.]|uniref:dihydrolipoyl dehydrogenase n=1 Tax=uncultured Clostridium sp. TaxID=59620 RepID=UPI0028E67AF8|nr:dihydrolipoyl dehydrogenase [uncultured Clostridium sp.]
MDIKLERLSGHNKSAKVGKISVAEGDKVKKGQVLMQLETSKGNTPFKASFDFKIDEIKVSEGDDVKIGHILLLVTGENISGNNKVDYFGSMLKGKKENVTADLTIIGGGPGGYVAGIYAAKKGLDAIIIEKENLGGTCLNVGCIPTKAFVKSSEVFHSALNSEEFGFTIDNAQLDMKKVVKRKDDIKGRLVNGIEYLLEANGVRVIKGEASFLDNKNVIVKKGKDEYTVDSKDIIIATGSKISKINIKGIDMPFVLNSTTALSNEKLPESITIIGGGVIGMEFAFIYSNFGVKVNVVEYADRLLLMMDKDISEEIKCIATDKGINIYTSSKVTEIKKSENGDAIVSFEKDGEEKLLVSENVLVAIGREPNIDGLNIENINLELNDNGRGIKVNSNLETNVQGIYAIGDVNNIMQLAHVASHQGMIAIDNILGQNKEISYDHVPNVIFTVPEIASVGMNEDKCLKDGLDIKISKFPYSANGKALTMGEEKGFIKIIKDINNNKIVGASIIGVDASSLISTLTLMIKNNISEEKICETIFAHPTTGEVIHESVLGLSIGAIHNHE